MPIVLYRVDDRLIHGQVVVGWGTHLDVDYIAVVDDALAPSEWEQELYRAGLSARMEGRFVTVQEARHRLAEWKGSPVRGILLTRDLETMLRLAEGGILDSEDVNLGGLHEAPGRRRVLSYLFLGDADRRTLAALARAGVKVSARDVPGARRVALRELLEGS
ncbi:MAG: PTS sugar transporter subunit IIB [Gemmatimonadetes bacterium]|nr:PTS sugar transporter subunit IIB [Gemmatimonadota bacterium]